MFAIHSARLVQGRVDRFADRESDLLPFSNRLSSVHYPDLVAKALMEHPRFLTDQFEIRQDLTYL